MWPFKKKEIINDLIIKGSMNRMEQYILSIRNYKDRNNLYTLFALATLEASCRGTGSAISELSGVDRDECIKDAIDSAQQVLNKDVSKSKFHIVKGDKDV